MLAQNGASEPHMKAGSEGVMPEAASPGAALPDAESPDGIAEADLARVMQTVPLGAGVLAGGAVALLVIGWLLIYLLVFLPRGTVG
jgi:hypothetical protein